MVSQSFSVVRLDEELYLFKDVVDHIIDLLGRHRPGMLGSLDNVQIKGLDVAGQRILTGKRWCQAKVQWNR